MKKSLSRAARIALAANLGISLVISACSAPEPTNSQSGSDILTVDLHHSRAKWQSIGNCWIYAAVGWLEAMEIRYNPGIAEPNYSETYLTYRHYEEQLLRAGELTEVDTAGNWYRAQRLIRNYGVMTEADFVSSEAEEDKSEVQDTATNVINESLISGPLSLARDPQTVRAELDRAFGVKLADLQDRIINAEAIALGTEPTTGKVVTLREELANWYVASWYEDYYREYANATSEPSGPFPANGSVNASLLRRVKEAINTGHPVMISWAVDFNALDTNGVFSMETLRASGRPGGQGGHLTVIEDYTARVTLPDGTVRDIGEGQVSQEDLDLALKAGEITSLIIKNSWGSENRPNRTSYLHDGRQGFHRLDMNYLLGAFPWKNSDGEITGSRFGLSGFVIPHKLRPTPPIQENKVLARCEIVSDDGEANVRSAPQGERLDVLFNGNQVNLLARADGWAAIEYITEGTTVGIGAGSPRWINESLLGCANTAKLPGIASVPPKEAPVCMVASADGTANVRSAPNGALRNVLTNGDRIIQVAEAGSWLQVEFIKDQAAYGLIEGAPLWIHQSILDCQNYTGKK